MKPTATTSYIVAIIVSLLAMIASILFFHNSDLDMTIQRHLFDNTTQQWIWDRNEPISRFLFYDGIRITLGIYALVLLVALIASRSKAALKAYRRPMLIALLTIAVITALVNIIKPATNVPCPRSVAEFGGRFPHIDVLDRWPPEIRPERVQRCFPAGHASSGFALLALVFFVRSRRRKIMIALAVVTLGWVMGAYKMAIGDHFFSHTLMSLLLSWHLAAWFALLIRNDNNPEKSPA